MSGEETFDLGFKGLEGVFESGKDVWKKVFHEELPHVHWPGDGRGSC